MSFLISYRFFIVCVLKNKPRQKLDEFSYCITTTSTFGINKFCKDLLIEVIADISYSLKNYFTAKKNKEQSQLLGEEIHVVVSKVSRLTWLEIFKIIKKLIHGSAEDF